VTVRYLVGADGNHSSVRGALGIRMLGRPILGYRVNILFRADLAHWVRDREINICLITSQEAPGLLLYNGADNWRYTAFYYPDRGQHPEDFTHERCIQLIRIATGVPNLSVELGEVTPWNDAALVAELFSHGRVLLAGDATHMMSPWGDLP
jgi:putative polyketide hydroxylase